VEPLCIVSEFGWIIGSVILYKPQGALIYAANNVCMQVHYLSAINRPISEVIERFRVSAMVEL
jgi:hypothetical protein